MSRRCVTDTEARIGIDRLRARLATTAMCASTLQISTTRITRLLQEHDLARVLFACVAAQRLSVSQIAHQLGTAIEIVRQMLTQQPKAVKQASRLADARTR